MPATAPSPRRALIVSADIGEGHNAAGRAIAEAIPRAWPGCRVSWLDALEAIGPRFARLARRFYRTQVQSTPSAYEFFFSAMWRHRWYLESTRLGAGTLFGRRMVPHIRTFGPEVVISTYPLGSAGLSWLRRRGQLSARVAAWVPAFSPHPSWLYPQLDITYVMHPEALKVAEQAEPGIRVAVGALPVRGAFVPGDQVTARERLGLSTDRFTAVISNGSLGLGRMDRTVAALLNAGPEVQVIAVCGRNERLRGQLAARPWPPGRLRVLGWTDDMPSVLAAADAVVTNGGGGTALEAIASGRLVVMCDLVPGHGRANAELMTAAGLALLAPTPADLTDVIRWLADDPGAGAVQTKAALARAAERKLEDDLAILTTTPVAGRGDAIRGYRPSRAG
jgi:UDP-N-acetylglucosamine:LPS N-acetylglucosamine transferase